jgi:multidrug efflux pump subunit AcrB
MKKIVSLFVKYPFYGKMFIAALVLIGGISLYSMKKATFPLMESHNISITVSYPGATPKEMEEGVTTLVENAIRGLAGIKEFSSESRENISSINVTALSNYNIDELLYEIKNAVDAISNFPGSSRKAYRNKAAENRYGGFSVSSWRK